jgi:hypothetical protein
MLAIGSEESLQKITGYQGDALLQRITEATRGYVCAIASETPLAIVFDDLHWMDEASLTLLSNLVDLVEENPILLLCLMRPEMDTPAWNFNQRIQRDFSTCSRQIELSPFSDETTNTMLLNLLGTRDAQIPLRPDQRKSGGQPVLCRRDYPLPDRDGTDHPQQWGLACYGEDR